MRKIKRIPGMLLAAFFSLLVVMGSGCGGGGGGSGSTTPPPSEGEMDNDPGKIANYYQISNTFKNIDWKDWGRVVSDNTYSMWHHMLEYVAAAGGRPFM